MPISGSTLRPSCSHYIISFFLSFRKYIFIGKGKTLLIFLVFEQYKKKHRGRGQFNTPPWTRLGLNEMSLEITPTDPLT